MSTPLRYLCSYDTLPLVESVLAEHEYTVEVPLQRSINGTTTMMMSCGATSVLLTHTPGSEFAMIEIWGDAQESVAELIESLPINAYEEFVPVRHDSPWTSFVHLLNATPDTAQHRG